METTAKNLSKMGKEMARNDRIQHLWERNHDLAQNHKRDLYVDNPEFLVYHWSGQAATFSPATGETAADADVRINIGDHNCRVDNGQPFPKCADMPSKLEGYKLTPMNFARDYAFFLDNSPAEIYEHEHIVGEFHWQLDEARYFQYPQENKDLALAARKLGAGGISFNHTCPDLSIGLELGWVGLLEKIEQRQKRFDEWGNEKSSDYLKASSEIVKAIIRFVERHADKAAGIIDHEYARDLVAELYLKYGGNYFSFGGRDKDLKDATNEMSWIGIEAYDMTGGYNQLGAMWHSDIDQDFWEYACDVVGRHGCGAPTLVNYDLMRASELRSGYSEEDAWNISYSGCQWYCSVGKEYNDQDLNSLVLIQPMQRAMKMAAERGLDSWDGFWKIYSEEVDKTADALVDFKNNTYIWQPLVWPEFVTSLCMHGTIENGKDVTDSQAVSNNYTSVNVLGVPNVADSMYALREMVFEQKKCTMEELLDALAGDWAGREKMRQEFLNLPKYGNDIDEVDQMEVAVAEHVRQILEGKRNNKGFNFRPSLFQFMGHTYAGPMLGAMPDGRKAAEPIAHGNNPMHGRNTEGMAATMHSFCKIDYAKYQGGSFQVELTPSYFNVGDKRGKAVREFATSFFQMGGVQINLNVVDVEQLKKAMRNPEQPEYKGIVVKVTGYSAHFVVMDRKFQEEFVQRVNYASL